MIFTINKLKMVLIIASLLLFFLSLVLYNVKKQETAILFLIKEHTVKKLRRKNDTNQPIKLTIIEQFIMNMF